MIKYSTGYIEKTYVTKQIKTQQELSGNTLFRSSKGRPYKIAGNHYLERIFGLIWTDTKKNGILVGKDLYQFDESVYNKIIEEKNYLPDAFYDALFFEQQNLNSNLGLQVKLNQNDIVDYTVKETVKSYVDLQKGSGWAYATGKDNVELELAKIASRYKVLECIEAAAEIREYLESIGEEGSRVELFFDNGRGFVVSGSFHNWGEAITINGYHTGILYNGKVYDNIHPEGLSYYDWLNDFDGIVEPQISFEEF